jgi:hypothetical protein
MKIKLTLILCLIVLLITGVTALQEVWNSGSGETQSVTSDGINIFAATSENLKCLNPDGTQRWSKTYTINDDGKAIRAGQYVYIGTDDDLRTLNKDGSQKWTNYETLGTNQIIKYIFAKQGYIIVSNDNKAIVLERETGKNVTQITEVNTLCKPYLTEGFYLTSTSTGIQAYKSIILPDLYIKKTKLESGKVTATIENKGLYKAKNVVVKFFYMNKDGSLKTLHRNLGDLEEGQSRDTPLYGNITAGYITVDPYFTIKELNEKNNQYYFTYNKPGNNTEPGNNSNETNSTNEEIFWLEGFNNKAETSINYTGTEDLTNYTITNVLVNFQTGKMKNNFDDIRFTWNNQTLNYTLKNKIDGEKAYFDIKVPLIKGNSITNITMFSGNVNAVSLSNPDSSYLLYDHFEGTELNSSKWEITAGTPVISNSILTLAGTGSKGLCSKKTFNAPIYLESKSRMEGIYSQIGIGPDRDLSSKLIAIYGTVPSSNAVLYASNGTNYNMMGYSSTGGTESIRGIGYYNHISRAYENGQLLTGQIEGYDPSGVYYIEITGTYATQYVDYILARNYIYPEPVLENWGSWISKI